MATLSTSNSIAISVSNIFEGMARVNDDWSAIYDVKRDDVGALRLAALQGLGNFSAWGGAGAAGGVADVSTVTPDSFGSNTLEYQAYAMQVKLPRYLSRDVGGLLKWPHKKWG